MEKLTRRQQEILDLVQNKIQSTGLPPTRMEIANEFGFRSANAAEEHLRALQRKGVIEMLSGTSRGIRIVRQNKPFDGKDPLMDQQRIPVIGQVAAGKPLLAIEHVIDHLVIATSLFHPKADFFLRVNGMSMKNAGILDGDLVAVHKTQIAQNGQIVVARLGDEVTLKRFKKINKQIYLLAANPQFQSIVLDPENPLHAAYGFCIEGIAVGVLRTEM